ncbi:MAG: GxxExxY protein [Burkholderiales bacterium]
MDEDTLSHRIIGASIEVHRNLGPGLLESIYETALEMELNESGLQVRRQMELPVLYKGKRLEGGYRVDLVVENLVIVEIKAVERLLPLFESQLLTYLKLSGMKLGLLINFNSSVVSNSVRRVVNKL